MGPSILVLVTMGPVAQTLEIAVQVGASVLGYGCPETQGNLKLRSVFPSLHSSLIYAFITRQSLCRTL